jgi:hypothetical protein
MLPEELGCRCNLGDREFGRLSHSRARTRLVDRCLSLVGAKDTEPGPDIKIPSDDLRGSKR